MTAQHLYLTGYRGCGKTTVAKVVAQQLNMTSIDLDDLVETNAQRSIREIFDSEGETGFRDQETDCLQQLALRPPMVIALGGGAILRDINRQLIAQTGKCVWLDAAPNVIATRLCQDETTTVRRPALTDLSFTEEIQTVMLERRPLYEAASDLRIDTTDKTIEWIAGEISQWTE